MLSRLRFLAEAVAASLLFALFLTFLLQIFSRYVLESPLGWTLELCLTLWTWIVFWGCAFIVKPEQHVSFDLVYQRVNPRTGKIFALAGAAAIATSMAISVIPTWDYIDFMQIQKSPALRIPLRTVFSIYAVFLVAIAVSSTWRFFWLLRSGDDD